MHVIEFCCDECRGANVVLHSDSPDSHCLDCGHVGENRKILFDTTRCGPFILPVPRFVRAILNLFKNKHKQ